MREQVPPGEIATIYLFQPIRRQGREWGTAVVTRRAASGAAGAAAPGGRERLRVYTAQYMLVVRGKERGQVQVEVIEVGLSPAEVLAQVMRSAVERGGELQPPLELGPEVWYEG